MYPAGKVGYIYTYIGRGNLPHVTLVNNQATVQEDITSEYISQKRKRNSEQVISKNNREKWHIDFK